MEVILMMSENQEQKKKLDNMKRDIIRMIESIDNEKFIKMVYFYVRSAYNEEKAGE